MKHDRMMLAATALVATLFLLTMGASVASADILNLTTAGASVTSTAASGSTFIVQQGSKQSAGSGVIDPFIRIQPSSPSNPPNEAGYNTGSTPILDDLANSYNQLLPLSVVPIVTLGGVDYRQFLLDINQSNGGTKHFLSLNQIQIFTGGPAPTTFGGAPCDSSQSNCTTTPNVTLTGLTQVFQMSTDAINHQIKLDADLTSGSGEADMFLYVPNSVFTGGPDVTLFSQFGDPTGDWRQTDGYEEWATLKGSTSVPDGGLTLMLLGGVLVGVETMRRRLRA